jgi:signal-transduction protein with cAMP-binding, CBS, and nucleotidyltransferase domain
MDLRVEDVVIRKAVTIDSSSTVAKATEMMRRHSTSSLIVLTGKKIEGFLSTRDVVSRVVAKGLDSHKVLVKEVMTKPVIMMRPDTPLGEAMKVMLQRKIKKLPLVEGEKDKARIVGLISITDLVEFLPRIFSKLWEEILITVPAAPEEGEFSVVHA